ncbi:MAG: hypothetical protein AAFY02_10640 [Pseudomonadota bacterium]
MSEARKADVTGNVGSRVVFENDKVIVWDFELQPGEETEMHRHDKSYIWYAIQGGPLDCEDEHGNDLGVFDVPTGSVFNIKYADGQLEVLSDIAKGTLFPATHKAKNAGSVPYREILIEFKD